MEIDLPTILLGSFFTIALVLPFVLISRSINRRKEMVKRIFKTLAKAHNLNLKDQEIWGDKGFALDESQQVFIYVSARLNKKEFIINLSEVSKVNLNKETLPPSKDASFEISKVELSFDFIDSAKPGITYSVFDIEEDDPFDGGYCYQISKRWLMKIEKFVKPGKEKKLPTSKPRPTSRKAA